MFTDGAEKSAFTPFEVSLNYLKAYDPAKSINFQSFALPVKMVQNLEELRSELIVDDIEIINAE